MKKLLALALALVLCLSLATTAFAATVTDVTTNNTDTAEVLATYVDDTTTVYSVDVTWGALTYTYTTNSGTWNPATLSYTGASAGWTATAPNTSDVVSVANRSNHGVRAAISSQLTAAGAGLTLGFNAGTPNETLVRYYDVDYALMTAGQAGLIAMDLAAAVPAVGETAGTAYTGTFNVTVDGTPGEDVYENTAIANLTITISTDGWDD